MTFRPRRSEVSSFGNQNAGNLDDVGKAGLRPFGLSGRFGLAVLTQAGIFRAKNSCVFKRDTYIMQPSVVLLCVEAAYSQRQEQLMRIDFVEIANFRKLRLTRVGFAKDKTVFVGANNSGKTSAMVALRWFLVDHERSSFTLNDFTISHWPTIIGMGNAWEKAIIDNEPLPEPDWQSVLPALDVWLHVESNEVHYVQKILPTLDWEGGELGVRLRFEPKDSAELQKEYLAAREEVKKAKEGGAAAGGTTSEIYVSLWPNDLADFLQRRLRLFVVRSYTLDPEKRQEPEHGIAKPQVLPADAIALDDDPFKGLIKIDEISAQRGFGHETEPPPRPRREQRNRRKGRHAEALGATAPLLQPPSRSLRES